MTTRWRSALTHSDTGKAGEVGRLVTPSSAGLPTGETPTGGSEPQPEPAQHNTGMKPLAAIAVVLALAILAVAALAQQIRRLVR